MPAPRGAYSVGAFQVEMHSVGAFQVEMLSVGAFYETMFKYTKLLYRLYDTCAWTPNKVNYANLGNLTPWA